MLGNFFADVNIDGIRNVDRVLLGVLLGTFFVGTRLDVRNEFRDLLLVEAAVIDLENLSKFLRKFRNLQISRRNFSNFRSFS